MSMAKVTVFLEKCTCSLHLLLPPLPQDGSDLRPSVDLKGKGEGCFQMVVDPIKARAWAGITNFLARCTKRALTVVFVKCLQDLHHLWLVSLCKVLHVKSPRHIHSFCATVNGQERRGLVSLHELLENASLSLTEWSWPWVGVNRVKLSLWLPLLIPIAVQVHPIRVCAKAKVPLFNLLSRYRVAVYNNLEFAVLQHIGGLRAQVGLPAKRLDKVQPRLGRDQLPRMLPKEHEDLICRTCTRCTDGNQIDGTLHAIVASCLDTLDLHTLTSCGERL
mmetsp:Transcript_49173/g.97722  ORF Transcript_49173/g.97722 Transcript_49173/m.97722 type:complete len:276 (-) Transcript_49173:138-965(-)